LQAHLKASFASTTLKLLKEFAKKEFLQFMNTKWLHPDDFKKHELSLPSIWTWYRHAVSP
jgi:hypothetical protein